MLIFDHMHLVWRISYFLLKFASWNECSGLFFLSKKSTNCIVAKTSFEGFGSVVGLFRFFIKGGFDFFLYFDTISWENKTKRIIFFVWFYVLTNKFSKRYNLIFCRRAPVPNRSPDLFICLVLLLVEVSWRVVSATSVWANSACVSWTTVKFFLWLFDNMYISETSVS